MGRFANLLDFQQNRPIQISNRKTCETTSTIYIFPMSKESLLPFLLENRELSKNQEKMLQKLFKEITLKSKDDKDAEDWFIIGTAEFRNEQYEEALDAFTFAIDENESFEAAWCFRGTAHGMLSEWDQALENVSKAIELDPQYEHAYIERAAVHRNMKNWDEALADLDHLLELSPGHESARLMKAKTCYDKGDYKQAIELYTLVLADEPGHVEALSSRGLAYFFEGNAELALKDIRKARTLEGGSTVSEFNMGLAMSALPEFSKQAYRHFEKAFKRDRNILKQYVKVADSHESERLLSRLRSIHKDLEKKKDENFYTRELYDLLERRLSEVEKETKSDE